MFKSFKKQRYYKWWKNLRCLQYYNLRWRRGLERQQWERKRIIRHNW